MERKAAENKRTILRLEPYNRLLLRGTSNEGLNDITRWDANALVFEWKTLTIFPDEKRHVER
jgi:hypothetical protein